MSKIDANLARLGIELPPAPSALGNFAPYLLEGTYLYISGQISADYEGRPITGKIGRECTPEHGYDAARFCAINILARAKAALGDLERIEKLIKLGAFVNAEPDFAQHPRVVNGASDFMAEVLGSEKSGHVRFAVGSSSLPSNASVEIEAVFRVTL